MSNPEDDRIWQLLLFGFGLFVLASAIVLMFWALGHDPMAMIFSGFERVLNAFSLLNTAIFASVIWLIFSTIWVIKFIGMLKLGMGGGVFEEVLVLSSFFLSLIVLLCLFQVRALL